MSAYAQLRSVKYVATEQGLRQAFKERDRPELRHPDLLASH